LLQAKNVSWSRLIWPTLYFGASPKPGIIGSVVTGRASGV